MIKNILLLLTALLCLCSNSWATDYTQYTTCEVASYLLDVDENPVQDESTNNRDGTLKGADGVFQDDAAGDAEVVKLVLRQ